MNLLLVNSGSSSLKVSICNAETEEQLVSGSVDWAGGVWHYALKGKDWKIARELKPEELTQADHGGALRFILKDLKIHDPLKTEFNAISHRVVHGGDLTRGTLLSDEILSQLEKISNLAPLHNPAGISAIKVARQIFPKLPQVAVFDTAFHHTMLPEASHYAIPQEWVSKFGVKRYGFHGLSHAYCASQAATLLKHPAENLRVIICHLGHGCSVSAVSGGRCMDTTMGFTPLEGLMMATRSGSIDAGAVLHILRHADLSPDEVSTALNKRSGLLGVSGVSADMREVLASADKGNKQASLAIDMFCYRVRQTIGAFFVTLGGADALVFTAGIGENSPPIRKRICNGLEVLGFSLDDRKNQAIGSDGDISESQSLRRIVVIRTREEVTMIREVRAVLA